MCPPDFYGIEYEINPWMSRSRGSSPERASSQWQRLHDTLIGLGVTVELMTPQKGLPDLVFTANAGLMFGNRFFSSRFRHEVRARETPHFDAWFAEHGFTVEHLPEGMFFEGAGDALFCGASLFAGYRIRSDVRRPSAPGQACSHRQVLPLELVNPYFYHLDTCFCPLAPGEAIYYPEAFDAYGRKVLENAHSAAARGRGGRGGALRLQRGGGRQDGGGERRLRSAGGGPARVGLHAGAVELDEFLKSGGSAKCLTLRLDGEEAAVWQ